MAAEHEHEPMPEGEEPPPPGVKTMGIVRWVILALAAGLAVFMWIAYARDRAAPRPTTATAAPKYQCPMHPQVVSDEPGECPICHMDLVPIAAERSATTAPPPASSAPLMILDDSGPPAYFCPMETHVRSAKPGHCPLCKMALEPIPPGAAATASGAPGAAIPPGTTPITIALDRIQAIGVRTALVEEREVAGALRVTAIVQSPEQGAAEVHVRTAGFVEAIHVDQTGRAVQAGQPLLALYSPEILQAQQELLVTRAWSGDASVTPNAARTKLELFGMTKADIERVLAKREPMRAMSVVAPRGGFVTKKNVVLGSYVTPETVLYEIQDLSRVYVVGDVFLRDLPHVTTGAEARFVPSGRSSDATNGKIDLVYPLANNEARTRRVRMQIDNNKAGRTFTPGEYGTIEVAARSRRALTIPRDALVDTGASTYVFLVEPEGRFVPKSVTVSGADGDRVVVDGLDAGQRVVSGATFLIDSESRLQASVSGASTMSDAGTAPASGCDGDFDRAKFPGKHAECVKCETVHRGMGSMEADCKNAIPRPWK